TLHIPQPSAGPTPPIPPRIAPAPEDQGILRVLTCILLWSSPMRGRARGSRWYLPAALAVTGLLLVVGWTLAAVFAESASPAPSGLPGDPTKGSQLYGQNCSSCHGSNLEGGIGPKLNPIENLGNTKNPRDPTYLVKTITDGLEGVGG